MKHSLHWPYEHGNVSVDVLVERGSCNVCGQHNAGAGEDCPGRPAECQSWNVPCPCCGGTAQKTSAPPWCATCGYLWPFILTGAKASE